MEAGEASPVSDIIDSIVDGVGTETGFGGYKYNVLYIYYIHTGVDTGNFS